MRIATLLPSATEIVCALGRAGDLVGVSHSCRPPPGIRAVPVMTGTRVPTDSSSAEIDGFVREHLASESALYDLDVAALARARPDVVVSQALCDVCAVATGDVNDAIASLPSRPRLVDLEPSTLDDVFDDILRVGEAIDASAEAGRLVRSLVRRKDEVAGRSANIADSERPGVAFLEWLDPPFNGGHWNPELVQYAGGRDLLGAPGQPSRTLDWSEISAAEPQVLFIACCGFDTERARSDVAVAERNPVWRKLPAVRDGRVYIADGSRWFASPGPRLVDGLEQLAAALHPGLHPPAAAGRCARLS